MYYNWQAIDFDFEFTVIRGSGNISIGSTGQLENSQNLFSAMPYDDSAQISVGQFQ